METSAILCNYAETQNNLLYLSGGGIDMVNVDARTDGPWPLTVGIGMTIRVPWEESGKTHQLGIRLLDGFHEQVQVELVDGTSVGFAVDLTFDAGRPANLVPGQMQNVNLAINLPGLPLPALGTYWFTININGVELQRLPISVVQIG